MKIIFLLITIICFTLSSQEWSKLNGPFGKSSTQDFLKINDSLFIVTFNDLLLSTDEGDNWKSIIEPIKNEISGINSVYLISDTIFICTQNNLLDDSKGNIYYKSLNSQVWEKIFNEEKRASYFSIQKFNNNYYIISNKYGLQYNENLNSEWNSTNNFTIYHIVPSEIIIINETIYAGYNQSRDNFGTLTGGGFLVSTDYGDTWTEKNEGLTNISINNLIYYEGVFYCGTENGLFKSINYGDTWTEISYYKNKKINSIEIFNNKILVISDNESVYSYENDKVVRIEKFNKNNIPQKIYIVNDKIYFISYGEILYSSDLEIYDKYDYISDAITLDLEEKDSTLYLTTSENSIFKYSLKNQNFNRLNDSLFYNSINPSQFFIKDSIIIADFDFKNSILISKNLGDNWEIINFNLDVGNRITDCILTGNNLIVSTRNSKFISRDLGQNWNKIETDNKIESSYLNGNFRIIEHNGLVYCYGNGVMTYDIESNKASFYIDTLDWKFFSTVSFFKKYDDISIIFNKDNELIISYDDENWNKIEKIFEKSIVNVLRYKNHFILKSKDGLYLTDYNFRDFKGINYDLPEFNRIYGDIKIIYDKLYSYNLGIYTIPLEDLGIEYTSVEDTERRSYLYTHPPFPQPTRGEIKIKTFWDSGVSFSPDDVNLYDINGSLIDIVDFKIINDTYNTGHIIFDTSSLNPGVYFVKINHGTEMKVCKILVN